MRSTFECVSCNGVKACPAEVTFKHRQEDKVGCAREWSSSRGEGR